MYIHMCVYVDSVLPFEHHLAIFGREKVSLLVKYTVISPMQLTILTPAYSLPIILYDGMYIIQGLEKVWLSSDSLTQWTPLTFDEEVHSVWCGHNYEYTQSSLRIAYSSLKTPKTHYDIDMNTLYKTILKVQDVPGYNPALYVTKRLHATAKDGTQIPLSIVHHISVDTTTTTTDNSNTSDSNTSDSKSCKVTSPTILYGYGSYGACIDPVFDYKLVPLLDRGVVYVIAHIRYVDIY